MDKKKLTETEVCDLYVTPNLEKAGWKLGTQIRREYFFTDGRVNVRGKIAWRGNRKRADYLLCFKPNLPMAVVEAKKNDHALGAGMSQAQEYAEMLDVPFAFSTNGDGFLWHDRTGTLPEMEREIALSEFPSPDALWTLYCRAKQIDDTQNTVVTYPYHSDGSSWEPRYYQTVAINRAVEAVARGQNRILLVMATGTGKTYTAFQIIWRLWKADIKKRILFLADRNILVDQTRRQDFAPFGDKMTKITNREIDKSYEIYLSLYQAVTGTEEWKNIYKQFEPDFFDLIVVDECHRGSAADDSAWHEVLKYFAPATHVGLTATPKETEEVSNITYFGDPIYTYSLKQGIEDGFLAPYKVIRVDLDKDLAGWRPEKGKVDERGQVIEDRIYNRRDFDRSLVLKQRTEVIARLVTEYLREIGPYSKTIVFCEDIEHATRMRTALVNANPDLVKEDSRYVVKITGDDPQGKVQLDYFIEPQERYPVIATTSKLLSTGVDVKTCKLIVLDQTIQSVPEFKQIIGRGTRIKEDFGKLYFTIMDFRGVTDLFADKRFDGDPVVIYDPKPGEPIVPPEEPLEEGDRGEVLVTPDLTETEDEEITTRPGKYYVGDVAVNVYGKRVQYYGPDGKLISESLRDYTRKQLREQFTSLDTFLTKWSGADRKQAIVRELKKQGIFLDALAEEVGKDHDPFDLICHVAFDKPPLTRKERANSVRKRNYFTKYGDQARTVLDALLDKYADGGIANIEDSQVLELRPINQMGTRAQIIREVFGGKEQYWDAIRELEQELYRA